MTDEEVVKSVLEGNIDDFALIVERYEKKLARYIWRLSGVGRADIEDILQDIFIKVYKNLNSFDTDLSFSSWIYRLTRNEVISGYRRKMARAEGYLNDVKPEVLENLISGNKTDASVASKLLRRHLCEALEAVPERYKEVLILRYFEDRNYEEISEILRLPVGTVSTLLHRAKKKLRGKLNEITNGEYEKN